MNFKVNPIAFRQIQKSNWSLNFFTQKNTEFKKQFIIKQFILGFLSYSKIKVLNYKSTFHDKSANIDIVYYNYIYTKKKRKLKKKPIYNQTQLKTKKKLNKIFGFNLNSTFLYKSLKIKLRNLKKFKKYKKFKQKNIQKFNPIFKGLNNDTESSLLKKQQKSTNNLYKLIHLIEQIKLVNNQVFKKKYKLNYLRKIIKIKQKKKQISVSNKVNIKKNPFKKLSLKNRQLLTFIWNSKFNYKFLNKQIILKEQIKKYTNSINSKRLIKLNLNSIQNLKNLKWKFKHFKKFKYIFLLKEKLLILKITQSLFYFGLQNINIKLKNLNWWTDFRINKNLNNLVYTTLHRSSHKILSLKDFIFITNFSTYFGSTSILSEYFINEICKVRRQWQIIYTFKTILFTFVQKRIKNLKGFKIMLIGRIQGRKRTKKFNHNYGPMPVNKISADIRYSLSTDFNLYGMFSLRLWLYYKY
jgi:hypothetical protein